MHQKVYVLFFLVYVQNKGSFEDSLQPILNIP